MSQYLSIIVPVHNKESYLEKTLNSILKQTYINFEVILVNDGSTDGSLDLCLFYKSRDSRFKVINQSNAGVSNARNTGIKHSSYPLIAFIDADDYWDPLYLQSMVSLIERYPEVNIYSSRFAAIKNSKVLYVEDMISDINQYLCFDLFKICHNHFRMPMHTSSVIIRKSILESVGYFNEKLNVFEDYDLFTRIALKSKIAYLNSNIYSFYNLDVPDNSKVRGTLPSLKSHWINYIENSFYDSTENIEISCFINTFTLIQLVPYKNTEQWNTYGIKILNKIHFKYISPKYLLFYHSPEFIRKTISYIYNILKPLRTKNKLSYNF